MQPKPEPADWTQLEVPKHEAEVPEEAVQAELEAVAAHGRASSCPVEGRPAAEGDTVVVDLVAEDGSAQRDYVVELGSERLVEEIENGRARSCRGRAARGRLRARRRLAAAAPPSSLKEIKERVLPPLDDELAKSATEFDTLAELRAEIEARLRAQIEEELEGVFRGAAVDELVKASNVQASAARSSSCARASCSPGWRAASRRAGSTPAPICS